MTSNYKALHSFLVGSIGKKIVLIDEYGREKKVIISDVWSDEFCYRKDDGTEVCHNITDDFDFKPC